MKLIHLNVESFKYFDALVDFLENEKPDILSLVEATDGTFLWSQGGEQRDYIGELSRKFSWNSVYHPTVFRNFWDYQIGFGAAVLSHFPISVENKQYFWEQQPTILPHNHIVFSDKPKYERYPHAWKLSLPFLITKIQTEQGTIRLLTAHFHVSYECLETLQIWQNAERVAEYVEGADNTPLIFTGDLNIRNESMAIKTLSEKMTQQSRDFTNTLTPSIHPVFQLNLADPLRPIDHIFTKNVSVSDCQVREVVVSDHLPLVLDFSL